MVIKCILFLWLTSLFSFTYSQSQEKQRMFIKMIYEEALTKQNTYTLLKTFCINHPRRLSGSDGLEDAVKWSKSVMEAYNFDHVYLQDVMVPKWVRGETESASFINNKGKTENLSVLALGRSIATPVNGIMAKIIQVSSLEEIADRGRQAIKGKIVFINKPFEQHFIRTFDGYSETVKIRSKGPSEAARFGAVACIIRSVSTADDDFAHTGALLYDENIPEIPAAALGVKSAKKLARALGNDPDIELTLKINSSTFPDVLSHNVIGEITGSENPDKIILAGGHLDAWDVGQGAHDDGSGCIQSLMALQTLRNLGYKPKNTLRVVFFTNEENGSRGGNTYAEMAYQNNLKHIFALESDAGAFTPRAIAVEGPDSVVQKLSAWTRFFPDFTIDRIIYGGAGTDVGPLKKKTGTPAGSLLPDPQRYFDFHHSHADRIEAVNARELELGMASIASFIYLVDQLGI